jgi:hypothetical protein
MVMSIWKWNYKGFFLYVVCILVTSLLAVTSCASPATSPNPPSTYNPPPTNPPAEPDTTTTPPPTSPPPTPSPTDTSQSGENDIDVGFETRWEYKSSENEFLNEKVTGSKHWFTIMSNMPDETGASVRGLALTLDTELQFDWFDIENLNQTGPPTYEWVFNDVPPVTDFPQVTPKAHVGFDSPGPFPVTFAPGFDACRIADKTEFSEPDMQILTIELTPRDVKEIYTIMVGSRENELVNAVIVSPSTDEEEGIWLDPDGRWLDIWPTGLEIGTTYTYTITIEVMPKKPNIEFIPDVSINCLDYTVFSTETGSSVCYHAGEPKDGIGTWTWMADGSYVWHWGETLNRVVAFTNQG